MVPELCALPEEPDGKGDLEQRIANLEAITGLIPEHQAFVDAQAAALRATLSR